MTREAQCGELDLYRFLNELHAQLERVRETDKALKLALRLAAEFFGAEAACLVRLRAGRDAPELVIRLPRDSGWDAGALGAFLRDERPRLARNVLLAPVERRGRRWAALALRRTRDYERGDVRAVGQVARTVSRLVQGIDRLRLAEVRSRIERKILEQLRPKDLFYQILHGLRSLTRYDHSAAVLVHEPDASALEVVAEQVAWRKGKSRRIGERLRVTGELRAAMAAGGVQGFDLEQGEWSAWSEPRVDALAQALDYASGERREQSLLCAPIVMADEVLGVLKVASCRARALGPYEAEAVMSFLPHVAIAMRNLLRTRSLEIGMLEAERKHVMANLARGVAHDVNNALGSVLPLVQQMSTELREGQLDRELLLDDLVQIERSLKTCHRIFGGMLSFARAAGQEIGSGDLRRAVENTLAIVSNSLRRAGVETALAVPARLPLVRGTQGDLEQLVLNLVTNARDAMPAGGRLSITVTPNGGALEVSVEDDGEGIAADARARVLEPFFTTKPHGSGLGLSICRSIVWNMGGKLSIESQPGEGTRVLLRLPLARATGTGNTEGESA